jgi:putative transposase
MWWSAYHRDGLEGLLPRVRKDRGTLKGLRPEVLDAAIALRREVPSRSTATLSDILRAQRLIAAGQLGRSTLDRQQRGGRLQTRWNLIVPDRWARERAAVEA